ncbi:hypothetical protein ACP4OV_012132 [Aristida adscensionis]
MWRRRPEVVGGDSPGGGARGGGAMMDGARDARHAAGRRHIAMFVPATVPAAVREAEVAAVVACGGHCEDGGSVDQLTKAILKAIEDHRRQEEEAAAVAAGHLPSWLAALEIITCPSLVLPLTVITTMAMALSQGWLKLESVDLGEIIKDLYGHRWE